MGEKDCRVIDRDFLYDLKSGNLKCFYEYVEELENNLNICFRGHNNKVTIYKNNHIFWEIKKTDSQRYNIIVNFDHARYSPDWKYYRDKLEKLGFGINEGNISIEKEGLIDKNFVDKTFEIINEMFRDYFDYSCWTKKDYNHPNNINYFKVEELKEKYKCTRKKQRLIEKIFQQYLFVNVFEGDATEYFAYDLEYSPADDNDKNKPDILAVKFEEKNEGYKLVFIEVKSLYGSCEGKSSGFKDHLNGMRRYLEKGLEGECEIVQRFKDAISIIDSYKEIELRGFKQGSTPPKMRSFNSINEWSDFKGIEFLFVFTDTTINDICKDFNYVPTKNEMSATKWILNLISPSKHSTVDKNGRKTEILETINDIKKHKYLIANKEMPVDVRFMTYNIQDGLNEVYII